MQTILLIDDDATLRELLSDHLSRSGYRVQSAASGQAGLRLFEKYRPDLIILDLMMPDMDGWEVCRQLRAKSTISIIMLTAKGEEIDKLHGFRLGVDDYVTKPFSFAELAARVGAVLARAAPNSALQHSITSGDLCVNFDEHRVSVSGRQVDLTPTEYRLLETLAQHIRHTMSTEQLLLDVWGSTYAGDVEQVKHFIWTLRKKLEVDPGDPKHLLTERGFGYRFE
jgi:two-component system KDP operon response regulator KdpE